MQCGAAFEAYRRHPHKYCSPECYHMGSRGPRTTQEQRFWSKVDKSGDCWLWTACRGVKGYGQFYIQIDRGSPRLKTSSHRFSYQLVAGAIPDGMQVLHRCDTPACVRPDHLFLGMPRDNTLDMLTKGRQSRKLTEDQVHEIRRRRAAGQKLVEIGHLFGVSHQTVRRAALRLSWAHVA